MYICISTARKSWEIEGKDEGGKSWAVKRKFMALNRNPKNYSRNYSFAIISCV